MSLIENERTKLLAIALNNVGVATIITGVIAPAAAVLYGNGAILSGIRALAIGAVWLLAGIGLHLLAQVALGRLKQ